MLRDVTALIQDALADPACSWSLGGFGALATFARSRSEPVSWLDDGRLGLSTGRGAIAFDPAGLRPIAYETAFGAAWSHAVALCLPASDLTPATTIVTERGRDGDAVRCHDREAYLFDGGLGLRQAAFCLRCADPEVAAEWRAACGKAGKPDDLRRSWASSHRIIFAGSSRIEIFGDGADPGGSMLHLDEKLIRSSRTHAATAPIPGGFVPIAHLYPPHPVDEPGAPFRHDRHEAFQALLRRWGHPDLVALKSGLLQGDRPETEVGRHARMVAKVVAAQRLARW
ncbi:hypothetical protein [Methylobacterium sp.]|uniref:DUF6925 family protein n=1 Tax=Methylobacterium sp. TaxID=409 RepID=UPI0025DB52EB|nr:hypothetical protein [Methylobacterium sp.]